MYPIYSVCSFVFTYCPEPVKGDLVVEVFGSSIPPVIRLWIGEVGVHHLTGPHLIYQYNRFVQTKEWSVVVVVAMGELLEKLNSLPTYPMETIFLTF